MQAAPGADVLAVGEKLRHAGDQFLHVLRETEELA
jgi:hypothetical protein